jgi:hypothetical protein
VIGVVQYVLQPLYVFVQQTAIFEVDIVKTQKEKFGSGFNMQRMAVFGRY